MSVKPVPIQHARTDQPDEADLNAASSEADLQESSRDTPPLEAPPAGQRDHLLAGRRKYVVGALALVTVLFISHHAINWLTYGRFAQTTDNAYIRADITPIAARVQGYVETVHVADNQVVEAGDVLITLESEDYAARLAEADAALLQARADAERARASVAAANASVSSAQMQITAQQDRISEARAAIAATKAESRQAEDDLKRYSELAEDGFFPEAQLSTAQTAAEAARAALTRSQAAAATRQSELSVAETTLDRVTQDIAAAEAVVTSAEARIMAAQARVDAARLDLDRTVIRAPISGVVANRVATEGQLMTPGRQILSIVPIDDAYVIANFKETQVEKMAPGQKVHLHVDAYPKLKIEGRVASLAPASGAQFSLLPQDTATGNFTKIVQRVPVRIALSEEALATGLMRPGLSVEASVDTRKPD